jgi:Berberine and berberine like.
MAAQVVRSAERLTEAMSPWATGGSYLNFSEEPTDTRTAYAPHAYRRLAAIKAQVDPGEVLQANHTIRPTR